MTTITLTEERCRLRAKDTGEGRRDWNHLKGVVTRWLERAAAKKGRHINEPSVYVELDRDPSQRQTFLYAFADSFPDTMPEWLRTAHSLGPVVDLR